MARHFSNKLVFLTAAASLAFATAPGLVCGQEEATAEKREATAKRQPRPRRQTVNEGKAAAEEAPAQAADADVAVIAPAADNRNLKSKKAIAEMIRTGLRKSVDARRVVFHRYAAMRIGELDRTCDLSEDQVKKLQVASKGLVEQFTGKWIDSVAAWVFQMGGRGLNVNEQMVKQFVSEQMMANYELSMGVSPVSSVMSRQPIWVKAVKRTLTEDQWNQYVAYRKAQDEESRRAGINYQMNMFTRDFLLSESQQKQLRPLFEAEYRKHERKLVGPYIGSIMMMGQLYKLPVSRLENILDEAQLETWKQRSKQFGQLWAGQDPTMMFGPISGLIAEEEKLDETPTEGLEAETEVKVQEQVDKPEPRR